MPHVELDGIPIHYLHYGADVKPAAARVLYVHGTGCNARVFERHMRALASHHESVAIDLPGHGASGGRGYRSAVDYAFFVGELIEALGWRDCVVAGHSLGGGIALATGLYFERTVRALMLVDTGARLRVSPKILEFARRAAASGITPAEDSRFGYADSTPRAVIDEVNALIAGCDPAVKYRDWIADDSFDVMSRLPHLAMPALALCGEHDPLTPRKYHEYLRDNMPACELVVIANAGHWPFAENPAAFDVAVMKFLAGL